MMRSIIALCLLLQAQSCLALDGDPVIPLMPSPPARALIAQDAGVTAAAAALDLAKSDAALLNVSPYEWNARASTQRRSNRDPAGSASYMEWNVGVERALRLPAKTEADRVQAEALLEEARARLGEATNDAARALATLYIEWTAAQRAQALAESNVRAAEEAQAAVERRMRAGDAARLDVAVVSGELAEQRRLLVEARTQAAVALLRLTSRFPTADRAVPSWSPESISLQRPGAYWRDRIVAQSDELKAAQARVRVAQAVAGRARADKIPDPTVGLYTASEVGGRERIIGVNVSIPIPGPIRQTREVRALAAVDSAKQDAEVIRRRLLGESDAAVAAVGGAADALAAAREGVRLSTENARLLQRAYSLGEADLSALLMARRQTVASSALALQAETALLKTWHTLLVDAHLVWDLAHD